MLATMTRTYGDLHIEPLRVRILQIGRIRIGPHWSHADVRSTFWRLYINGRDGARLLDRAADRVYPLHKNAVHAVPPGFLFDTACTGSVAHLFIHFATPDLPHTPGGGLLDTPAALPMTPATRSTHARLLRRLPPRLDPGARSAAQGQTSRPAPAAMLDARALVDLALADVVAGLDAERLERLLVDGAGVRAVRPAVRLIEAAVAGGRAVPLAAACHISERTLLRRFNDHLGRTPHRYATHVRLSAAAERLVMTDATIDAIADDAGFPDRQAFTRAFSQHFGRSPAQYRRDPQV